MRANESSRDTERFVLWEFKGKALGTLAAHCEIDVNAEVSVASNYLTALLRPRVRCTKAQACQCPGDSATAQYSLITEISPPFYAPRAGTFPIEYGGERCSRSGSALVSVDCLCVAQGCIAGRRGNARAAKKYNVTLLNVPNLVEIGSTFLPVFSEDYTNIFSRAVEFGVSLFLCFGEADSDERCSPPFASARNRIFLSDIEALINISEVTGSVEAIRQLGRTKTAAEI
ncbi:hypothetical protein QQF64_012390 [Cirrhinus molitorella]|uniref:Uncharacterized protein n=1 Tax=Cirrhinus molitorella TaxID=172907 RepID=A0ABR3LWI0_9TELE